MFILSENENPRKPCFRGFLYLIYLSIKNLKIRSINKITAEQKTAKIKKIIPHKTNDSAKP
ncbi:MAG: hypothetical protein PHX25_01795 [Candidatus Pacebacteria bacterium]|nr:hypothetical protein [Candidatus Paceibacterota bacterium]